MALLKKVKASTLMETMVATVLIVVVFMMASLVMNNLFSNQIKFNTQKIAVKLNKLEYELLNKTQEVPYEEAFEGWQISVDYSDNTTQRYLLIKAKNTDTNRNVTREIAY